MRYTFQHPAMRPKPEPEPEPLSGAERRAAEADLARHEAWLAGDWDSRSARGLNARDRHAAARDRLRALLGIADDDRR